MKKYNVNVNGNLYEITLEVVEDGAAPAAAPTAPAARPAAPAAPAAAAPAPAGAETMKAPMPGNILSVNVQAGSTVKSGEVLMVLEAMKMENEIMAPRDGKIVSVAVSKEKTVETGSVLCDIE